MQTLRSILQPVGNTPQLLKRIVLLVPMENSIIEQVLSLWDQLFGHSIE